VTPEDWVIRPEHFLRYLREERGLRASETRLPRRLILVFGGDDLRAFSRMIGGKRKRWYRDLVVGRFRDRPVAVVRAIVGAPGTTFAVEDLGTLGVRKVVNFGACGSLRPNLRIGSYVVPSRAYSDEGTSRHYTRRRWSNPDTVLRRRLVSACERHGLPTRSGGVWTTDAPYRESRRKVRDLSAKGIVAVDMETSAVYTVARHRGMRAASLFVVSDELTGEDWRPGFQDPAFVKAQRRVRIAVLESVTGRVSCEVAAVPRL
jgi:uridine phosphorylase